MQPELEQLVYGVGVLDLDAVTEEIDEDVAHRSSTRSPSRSPRARPTDAQSSGSTLRLGLGRPATGSTSAARIASTRTGAVSSTCHGRAPYPLSCSATAGAEGRRVPRLRRRPQRAAQVVGGEQVLDREVVLLGERGDRVAGERQPAGGDRVLLGPGAGERRAVAARGPGRQVRLVQLGGLARARRPSGAEYRSAPRPWKPLVASSVGLGRSASSARRRRSPRRG